MVGLFWITPDAAYVGSPPAADGSCVRLTAHGLEAVGPDGSRSWAWEGLRSAVIEDVPRQGPSGRLSGILESLLSSVSGGEEPPGMTLRLQTEYGVEELRVYSAAAGGYDAEEDALSQELLARFVTGTANPRTLEAWGSDHGSEGTPKAHVRQDLLRAWAEI
ncbi:hypothetical protein [Streptomyces sp. R33]|uniref:Uncharacterized protein n=1 Tax=Streptomyces sp. R33 TaxID=3238629 RepID=A0AB39XZA0_9ACTN